MTGLTLSKLNIPSADGQSVNRPLVYQPTITQGPTALVMCIHGGGFVLGAPEYHEERCCGIARTLGVTIEGSAKSKQLFKAYFSAGYDMKFEPIDARVYESGNVAWVIGVLDETKPDGSVEPGKYVAIWGKIDGKWMNALDMRNANGGVPLVSA